MAAALVIAALAATGPMAYAQTQPPDNDKVKENREKLRQTKEDAARNLDDIDALNSDIDELVSAYDTLLSARDAAEEAVEATKRNLAEAETQQAETEARIAALEEEIATTGLLLQDSAVRAFISHQGPNSEQTALSSDPWQHERTQALRNFANRSTEDILDEFRGQLAELDALRARAAGYVAEVEQLRNDELERLGRLRNAVQREENALEDLRLRRHSLAHRAQDLEATATALAGEIEAELQRIAAAIAAAERRARGITVPPGAPVDLVDVWGILVNTAIEENVRGLLTELEADGFSVGGSGYRTNARQIELRKEHCGTSEFAIYEMSSSACSPPTARPGFSRHEFGLAIDFTWEGRLIRSRDTAVYQAIARIAENYGLYNLPSEPWHWSDTGG
ncbi:MAG: D-alanyl-D-alanine carboxypeptidase family protein [Acidimicrobiaceae bacterium]|nr:D-alanyl-D-alanine carboxypeptidase family protein [Acidimicrobiaceae bacterium]